MARITIEDCINKVQNKFELVLLAAQRARSIKSGAILTISKNDDKDVVIALREIATDNISVNTLKQDLINRLTIKNTNDIHNEEFFENNTDEENFAYQNENTDLYISEAHSDLETENL